VVESLLYNYKKIPLARVPVIEFAIQRKAVMSPYTYEHPRPALTVDLVIFAGLAGRRQILLIRRSREPFAGKWALPGGFVEMDESLEAAAKRELEEETGLRGVPVEQLRAFGDPGRDPRGRTISVAYYALLPAGAATTTKAGSDAGQARWFPTSDLPELAFDHAEIIAHALTRLPEIPG
jgi:8-oxo-dGTP diphosphatase